MDACVNLGLIDLTPQRAEILRLLNQERIPVSAWMLLSQDEGSWFKLDNSKQVCNRYHKFKSWSTREALTWNRIRLDIEPDIRALQALAEKKARRLRLFLQKANRHRLNRRMARPGHPSYF